MPFHCERGGREKQQQQKEGGRGLSAYCVYVCVCVCVCVCVADVLCKAEVAQRGISGLACS